MSGDKVADGPQSGKFTVFKADLVSSRWLEVKSVGRVHFLDDDVFCNGFRRQFGSYDMTCLHWRSFAMALPRRPGTRRAGDMHGSSIPLVRMN
jgi:hypothetical protein